MRTGWWLGWLSCLTWGCSSAPSSTSGLPESSGGSGASESGGTGSTSCPAPGGCAPAGGAGGAVGGASASGGVAGAPGGGSGGALGAGCQGTLVIASKPLDLIVLLDESETMSQYVTGGSDVWTEVAKGMTTFLQDPANASLDVALGYFPPKGIGVPPLTCSTDADCVVAGTSYGPCTSTGGPLETCAATSGGGCGVSDYSSPEVPLNVPPDHASALASLTGRTPGGLTPTRPALQGTLDYAKTWATAHPDRKVVVVLVTNGLPTGCTQNDVPAVQNAVQAAVSSTGIPTFVIGIGNGGSTIATVANLGGGKPYLVDATANLATSLAGALRSVGRDVLDCSFALPAGADTQQLNVLLSTPAVKPEVVPYSDLCASAGWSLGASTSPKPILLCPSVCDALTPSTTVSMQEGCATVKGP